MIIKTFLYRLVRLCRERRRHGLYSRGDIVEPEPNKFVRGALSLQQKQHNKKKKQQQDNKKNDNVEM